MQAQTHRCRAVSDQAQAAYDQSVANYRETVLGAFQDVEGNLAALRILPDEAKTQQGVLLVRGLGGGWDSSTLPARPECCGWLISQLNGAPTAETKERPTSEVTGSK